jgi:hypothetical protein
LIAENEGVRVRFAELRDADFATEIRVTVEGAPQEGPRLFPESVTTAIQKREGAVEIEIGDPLFDDTLFIGGEPAEIFARLDAATRRDLLAIQRQSRLYIARGELRVSCDEERLEAPLKTFLGVLIRTARRLFGPLDIAGALARNSSGESAPVRLRNLVLLSREYAADARTAAALRSALGDAVPEIRLRAAQTLGEEGVEVLAQLAADLAVGDSCSAGAVAALGLRLPEEQLDGVLAAALRRRRLETAAECIRLLGVRTGDGPVARLGEILRAESGSLAVAAARALGASPRPDAEAALIEALDGDFDELLLAVAESLAECGSPAAVLPLRQAAERRGGRELVRAARQAVAKIQSRAPGASPGQLSLAADAAGQVSLAPAEAGGVSLAPAQSGALSLGRESAARDRSGD